MTGYRGRPVPRDPAAGLRIVRRRQRVAPFFNDHYGEDRAGDRGATRLRRLRGPVARSPGGRPRGGSTRPRASGLHDPEVEERAAPPQVAQRVSYRSRSGPAQGRSGRSPIRVRPSVESPAAPSGRCSAARRNPFQRASGFSASFAILASGTSAWAREGRSASTESRTA